MGIYKDKYGKNWIRTAKGASVYDKGTLTNHYTNTNKPKYEWNKTKGDLWFYGRIWIGNNGIGVLLKEGETTINFSEKNNLIHPTSTRRGNKSKPGTLENVFAIEEDSEGNIWFGDRDTEA